LQVKFFRYDKFKQVLISYHHFCICHK